MVSETGDLPDEYVKERNAKLAELKANVHVFACEWEGENLRIPTGLLPSLFNYCEANQIPVSSEDKREFDVPRRLLLGPPAPTLRLPQAEALALLKSERVVPDKGVGLIRLATGVGKTALAQELIRHHGCQTIFLVPSLPILKQTVKRFEDAFGAKNVRAYGGGKKSIGWVTVATYQSVYKANPGDFDEVVLAISDECHHVAADTLFDVLQNKLKNAVHRYGLTAFEERADNATLLVEAAVGPVIYQYDAPQAIKDGFLARPEFLIFDVFATKGNWTKYQIKGKKRVVQKVLASKPYDGDNALLAYRHWVLGNDILNNFVAGLARGLSEQEGKSVLILVDEKEHGDRLMALIPGAGFCIGGGADNEQLLRDFNARKLKVLLGTSTLGEGADTIAVDVLICLQGGASESGTLQAVGRALRNDPHPDTGTPRKPQTLIIDFNFPMCRILDRHGSMREKVYYPMGLVSRGRIP